MPHTPESRKRPAVAESNRRRAVDPVLRFWRNIDKEGPNCGALGRCWIWTGGRDNEYGSLSVSGKETGAHRFSWQLHYGLIPEGLLVCHKCDRPLKGRQAGLKGEDNGNSVLTEEQVREIRRDYRRYSRTHGAEALAKKYGVSPLPILSIIKGKNWTHVI